MAYHFLSELANQTNQSRSRHDQTLRSGQSPRLWVTTLLILLI